MTLRDHVNKRRRDLMTRRDLTLPFIYKIAEPTTRQKRRMPRRREQTARLLLEMSPSSHRYAIAGLRSPLCARRAELAMSACARVGTARVSYLFGEAIVHGPASQQELNDVLRPLGLELTAMDAPTRRERNADLAFRVSAWTVAAGGAIATAFGEKSPPMLVACALGQALLALPLWQAAKEELSRRAPGSALAGATALFVLALSATGELVFSSGREMSSLLWFVYTLPVAWLSASLSRRTMDRWRSSLRATATRISSAPMALRKDTAVPVAVDEIAVGEEVLVPAGGSFPVDGRATHGFTDIDLSPLTGDASPRRAQRPDIIPAGAINLLHPIVVTSLGPAHASAASRLSARWEIARLTAETVWDPQKWEARLVALTVGLAAGAFMTSLPLSIWQALASFSTVVLTFCPLFASGGALSLLALLARARARGIHFRSALSLLEAGRIRELFFHKRGALTEGQPKVTDVVNLSTFPESVLLSLIASVEHEIEHPLGEAIERYAAERGYKISRPSSIRKIRGKGAGGQVERATVVVGSEDLTRSLVGSLEEWKDRVSALESEGKTVVYAAISRKLAALVAARDSLRPGAAAAIRALRRLGIDARLVSGDAAATVKHFAEEAGVRHWTAGLGPEERAAHVSAERRKGVKVAVVGTGPADSAALARADVSFLMRRLPSLEPREESVVLPDGDLAKVATAIRLGKRAAWARRIWAGLAVGFPAAAAAGATLAHLPPPGAALAVSALALALSLVGFPADKQAGEPDDRVTHLR